MINLTKYCYLMNLRSVMELAVRVNEAVLSELFQFFRNYYTGRSEVGSFNARYRCYNSGQYARAGGEMLMLSGICDQPRKLN